MDNHILLCLFLFGLFSHATTSVPITEAYPGVFSPNPHIRVTKVDIHGVSGYEIDPFPAAEAKRNHYDSRNGAKIKYLIMHYTAETFPNTVNIFTAESTDNPVSSHYVIAEKAKDLVGGEVLRVVPDNMRSWHAGISSWGADSNLNYVSLGIEHVNLGFNKSGAYYVYDPNQIKASGIISKRIMKQYGILHHHVLGHEDIAPPRKLDPGPLFPWAKLYHEHGVGAWLDADEMTKDAIILKYNPKRAYPTANHREVFIEMLISYGFSIEGSDDNKPNIILAFKKHFSCNQKPETCDHVVRDYDVFWAWALEAKYITAHSVPPTAGTECIDTSKDCGQTMKDCKNALYKPLLCKYCRVSLKK